MQSLSPPRPISRGNREEINMPGMPGKQVAPFQRDLGERANVDYAVRGAGKLSCVHFDADSRPALLRGGYPDKCVDRK